MKLPELIKGLEIERAKLKKEVDAMREDCRAAREKEHALYSKFNALNKAVVALGGKFMSDSEEYDDS